jgi:hypothetical protein
MEICGLPVIFWIVLILGIGIFVGSMRVEPRIGTRPPAHPPGWGNIKKGKKRSKTK